MDLYVQPGLEAGFEVGFERGQRGIVEGEGGGNVGLQDALVFVLECNEQVTDLRKHLQTFVIHEHADETLLFVGQ